MWRGYYFDSRKFTTVTHTRITINTALGVEEGGGTLSHYTVHVGRHVQGTVGLHFLLLLLLLLRKKYSLRGYRSLAKSLSRLPSGGPVGRLGGERASGNVPCSQNTGSLLLC